jgi:uncharacterized protein
MSTPADLMPVITLAAAFATGVAGSGHCFGMCGGLAAAYGSKARRDVDPRSAHPAARALSQVALHHAGRLGGYALLGGLAGAMGALFFGAFDLLRVAGVLRVATGVLIVAMGLRVLMGHRGRGFLEKGGARIWRHLAPIAQKLSAGKGMGAALGAGLVWGWLPCGLVYSMLVLAAATGSAATGAGTLLAFGAGTAPAMLTSGLLASQVSRLLSRQQVRPVAAVLLIACGVWTMLAAQTHSHADSTAHAPATTSHVHPMQ